MEKTIDIPVLPGECFWGGIVRHGDQMPFDGEKPIKESLYQNLWGNQGCPVLVSSKGRYVWSEEPFEFEIAGDTLRISKALGTIEQGAGHGSLRGAYLAVCQKFFPPSGRCPHELAFLAPQYNSWIDVKKHPTQDKVLAYADAILAAGMPPGVFMIDDFWYRNNGWWDWDCEAFPDPKAMVEKLHAQGFAVVLWVSPFVTPDTREFLWLKEQDYLLRTSATAHGDELEYVKTAKDIRPAIQSWWNGFSAVLDLSHPDAFAWFQGRLDRLVEEFGIDGFKFDGGDSYRYQAHDISHSPRTPNGHCEDFGRIGLKYPISEYRACWKLGGQHLLQRVRDKAHRWDTGGLADTIPTSLAQGLVGYPYTCPDMVGGGEVTWDIDGKLDQELFVRWAQSATFFPMVQYSLLPSRILDEKHLACAMKMIELRKEMGSKILELAQHAARTGEPIMRHMAYVFPDEGFEHVNDQYMVGDDLLVAPVLQKGAFSRVVRFPSGTWRGDDGSVVVGPKSLEVPAPLERLPWYTRQ
jgi:alpha-glucosidase (family GH31 glycosyl hydrolase)